METTFEQLAANIRLADLLDVSVIAVLLYCGLCWIRQRASRSLIMGVALLVTVFLCAHWLDMYLTAMLFEVGLLAMLLTLIVVFQQDIRRAFERLAVSGFSAWSRRNAPTDSLIDTLVESIVTLAETRTGALFVFAGREPLDRHVRGGVAVDARISLPLLYSIFHPQSPGHDGAVLIVGERIERLGVHLPLSKNLSQIGGRGTRHAAALGLAECSDALVLAVSEEHGTISVAQRERLRTINSAELKAQLERYYQTQFKPKKKPNWYRSLTRDIGVKAAALGIACILWLLFAYRVETIQRTFVVPIEYRNLPEELVIDEPHPTRAELTLFGSERAFDLLDTSSLIVSFDVSHVRSESPYLLPAEDSLKNVPAELSVNTIRPRVVQITVHRKPAGEMRDEVEMLPTNRTTLAATSARWSSTLASGLGVVYRTKQQLQQDRDGHRRDDGHDDHGGKKVSNHRRW